MDDRAARMFALNSPTLLTKVKVGVGVVVRDGMGGILLERRSDCGLWGLPGGRLEPGESLSEGARREVLEETGLAVRITRLLGVYSEPAERIVTYLDNGDVAHLVDVVVESEIVSGRLTKSNESEELRFFPLDALPQDMVPPARKPLQDIKTGRVCVLD